VVDHISWPELPAAQQPVWPDQSALADAVAQLRTLPPLVFAGECDNLTERLAAASQGRAFVLMGGDCAETFDTATAEAIRAKLKTVLQMAIVLTYGASLPVVKVGRMAGQYFKPRSKSVELRDGQEMTSYYGDGVNALPFETVGRERLQHGELDAQPRARVHPGRVCRPAAGARVEPGLRRGDECGQPL